MYNNDSSVKDKLLSSKGGKETKSAKSKSKGSKKDDSDGGYSWLDWRHCSLKLVYDAICIDPRLLWNMGVVQVNANVIYI